MPPKRTYSSLIVFLNFLFVLFFCAGIYHLAQKPGLPPEYVPSESQTIVRRIDGIPVETPGEVEFFLEAYRIGDIVQVDVDPAAGRSPVTVQLVGNSSVLSIIMDVVIALIIVALGAVVYLFRPDEQASVIFHVATLTLAAALMGTKTIYAVHPMWLGYTLCLFFFVAYTTIPVLFAHFTLVFPAVRWRAHWRWMIRLYAAAGVIAVWQAVSYLGAAHAHSIELFRASTGDSAFMNVFVFVFLLFGVCNFIVSYRNATALSEKKRLRWILYGLSIGPAPFIFLWVLPQAFLRSPWVPESIFKLFLLLIPITFSVSIVKYRLMDIDVIINRSAVYAIVIGVLLVVYAGIVGIIARFVSVWTVQSSLTVSPAAAILVALLFEPMRKRVQRFVDRSFFRIQYNFREAQRNLVEEIKQCVNLTEIARLVVGRTDELLPVERIGFFTLQPENNRIRLIAHKGFDVIEARTIRFEIEKLKTQLPLPVGLDDKIEPAVAFESADAEVFRRWGMALVFPMLSRSSEIFGFLVLGEKKSAMRFTSEDVDLLTSVTTQAGLAIERIKLQQQYLLEHEEAQRLEELNRLKSYFVSSVSHDLKTPLTSIKLFAEMLRDQKQNSPQEAQEWLEIIDGESERLTRLINNVLDFEKAERHMKQYNFEMIDLNDVVRKCVRSMNYQLKMEKCILKTQLCKDSVSIHADEDAVLEALENLMTNALKYSPADRRSIELSTSVGTAFAEVSVQDCGIGISEEDRRTIFEPFARARQAQKHWSGGTGLGLAVVKNVMDAHEGVIEVQSEVGSGSTFTLKFPMQL